MAAMRRAHNPDEDADDPRPEDVDAFADATVRCPECDTELYDDVDVCYKCGHNLHSGSAQGKPGWVVVVVILIVLGLLAPVLLRVI